MRWWNNIMENVKDGVRSWRNIQPSTGLQVNIRETLDFQGNAIKNKIGFNPFTIKYKRIFEAKITNKVKATNIAYVTTLFAKNTSIINANTAISFARGSNR